MNLSPVSMNTTSHLCLWIPPLPFVYKYHLSPVSMNTTSLLCLWISPVTCVYEYHFSTVSMNTTSHLCLWIPPLPCVYEYHLSPVSMNTTPHLCLWISTLSPAMRRCRAEKPEQVLENHFINMTIWGKSALASDKCLDCKLVILF